MNRHYYSHLSELTRKSLSMKKTKKLWEAVVSKNKKNTKIWSKILKSRNLGDASSWKDVVNSPPVCHVLIQIANFLYTINFDFSGDS